MIRKLMFCGLVVLLALPGARGRDEPKQDKKPPTAKEKFDGLVKEFADEQQKIIADYQKAKEQPDKDKLLEKFYGLGKSYADRFYKLAEENPNDPVAKDALFWIIQNDGSHKKAEEKILALIAEMELSELNLKLQRININGRNTALLDAVMKRAEKDEKDPIAADLLGWVAMSRFYFAPGKGETAADKAIARLIEKYPNHQALERVCGILAMGRSPKDVETLKQIIEKASSNKLKAEALLAIGQNLAAQLDNLGGSVEQADKLAAEAEKYMSQAIELFEKEKLGVRKGTAETELKVLRTLRIGKEAPEISGKDLDGKEFKLSDYRGKVVLLDFWGNW